MKKEVKSLSAEACLVLGSKHLIGALVFWTVAGIAGGILQYLKLDGGLAIWLCIFLALVMGVVAYSTLEDGDEVHINNSANMKDVNRFKVRFDCFHIAKVLQIIMIIVQVIMLLFISNEPGIFGTAARTTFMMQILDGAFALLILFKTHFLCLGYVEYAEMKCEKLGRLFRIGSVILGFGFAALMFSGTVYGMTQVNKAVPIAMTAFGFLSGIFFLGLLVSFIGKYEVKKNKTTKAAVFFTLITACVFAVFSLAATVAKTRCIKGLADNAVSYYKGHTADDLTSDKDGYNFNVIGLQLGKSDKARIVTRFEDIKKYSEEESLVVVKVATDKIEDTGKKLFPNYGSAKIGMPVFDNADLIEKYGLAVNIYAVTLEDGGRILVMVPDFMYEIEKAANNGYITFPIGEYYKVEVYDLVPLLPISFNPENMISDLIKEYDISDDIQVLCYYNLMWDSRLDRAAEGTEDSFLIYAKTLLIIMLLVTYSVARIYDLKVKEKYCMGETEEKRSEEVKEGFEHIEGKLDESRIRIARRTMSALLGLLFVVAIIPVTCFFYGKYNKEARIAEGKLVLNTFDSNGNNIYTKDKYGEYKYEYYENGKCKSCEITFSDGGWKRIEYNENEQVLSVKYLSGGSDRYIYDENGNHITTEYSDGDRTDYEYDENNKLLRISRSDGKWTRYTYDEKGNKISADESNGSWRHYKHDENGREIWEESSSGEWWRHKYDENGNEIEYESSFGFCRRCEYDEEGKCILREELPGKVVRYTYDEDGRLLYGKAGNEIVEEYRYDKKGNVIYYKGSYLEIRYKNTYLK